MAQTLAIEDFWNTSGVVLDVRSPGEYEQGHIPGAVSFPLFSNAERAEVGTCYKQQGRDAAVELGLELVGPKMATFVRQAKAIAPDRQVRVHCWRGGMRSGSMASLLETAGLEVTTLIGGYKAFRRWVRQILATPKPLIVLGGMTGTSKTNILHALTHYGQQVLDLEDLANHRGSSYGALGLPPQPSTEQFENLIATQWLKFTLAQPIWIEAESRRVGTCRIPPELMQQMEQAHTLEVTRSLEERLDLLVELYGQADPAELIEATERVRKRLGGQRTQAAIEHFHKGNLRAAVEIVLTYYDRTYRYDLERRNLTIPQIEITGLNPNQSAQLLIETTKAWGWY